VAAEADDNQFPFTGLIGRPPGALTRTLESFVPGVAEVQAQVPLYAAAWRTANLAALQGGHRRWVALGDSMTQGIGASAPLEGWVGQLVRRLEIPVDVINLSQSGARVEDVIAQQLPAWRALPPPPAGEILTVLIGANDVISPRHRNLLAEAFAELLDVLPAGAIVSTMPARSRQELSVNALLRDADRDGRIRAVPTETASREAWRGKLAADHFHPNDAGYATIADRFAPYVRAALDALA
jgi:lysophospholipase L1-like esterase